MASPRAAAIWRKRQTLLTSTFHAAARTRVACALPTTMRLSPPAPSCRAPRACPACPVRIVSSSPVRAPRAHPPPSASPCLPPPSPQSLIDPQLLGMRATCLDVPLAHAMPARPPACLGSPPYPIPLFSVQRACASSTSSVGLDSYHVLVCR